MERTGGQEQAFSIPKELENFDNVIHPECPAIEETTTLIAHTIKVASKGAIKYTTVPTSLKANELKDLQFWLSVLEYNGTIRSSNQKAGSPIRMIRPSTSSNFATDFPDKLQLSVCFNELNKCTHQVSREKIPLMNDYFKGLAQSRYFTRLELFPCHYRIRVADDSIPLTVFTTPFGMFEWLTLPEGLYDGPATIQKYLEMVLAPCKQSCVIYQHDILVHSRTRTGNVDAVRSVLEQLRKESLFVNGLKSEFFKERIDFLGYTLDQRGIDVQANLAKLNVKEGVLPGEGRDAVMKFLGEMNHYRKILPQFEELTGPVLEIFANQLSMREFFSSRRNP